MPNIKLICVDLDGTLLMEDHHTISPANIAAIAAANAAGIPVVPTTGRILTRLLDQLKVLPPLQYAIVANGAEVVDVAASQVLYGKYMSAEATVALLDKLWAEDVAPMIYQRDKMLMQPRDFASLDTFPDERDHLRAFMRIGVEVPDLRAHLLRNPDGICKINAPCILPEEKRQRLMAELREMKLAEVTTSMPHNIECNALGATKADGIAALCEVMGITPQQVMAIGDGENDIAMMHAVGYPVAMGNAKDHIRRAAGRVTESNQNDGVAIAIQTILKGGELPLYQ